MAFIAIVRSVVIVFVAATVHWRRGGEEGSCKPKGGRERKGGKGGKEKGV